MNYCTFVCVCLSLYIFQIFCVENVFDENPLITHYKDENEMRERLKKITDEKFSHTYHLNFSDADNTQIFEEKVKNVRKKRDGGLTMAVLSGVIGTIVVYYVVLIL